MLVAIDVDSTLHDYWEQFSTAALERHGIELPYEDQRAWAVDTLSAAQLGDVIAATHADDRIREATAYEGAADVIAGWRRAGHVVLITTHRRQDAHDVTAQWLSEQGIPYDLLRCGREKVDHCRAMGVGLLVDDAPPNLEGALACGIAAATISHPWNHATIRDNPSIVHAGDWPALGAALAPLLDPT